MEQLTSKRRQNPAVYPNPVFVGGFYRWGGHDKDYEDSFLLSSILHLLCGNQSQIVSYITLPSMTEREAICEVEVNYFPKLNFRQLILLPNPPYIKPER